MDTFNPDPKPPKPIRLKGKKLKKLFLEVLERDEYTCQYCGRYTQDVPHHVIFRSQGGSDIAENLVAICQKCHHNIHFG